LGAEAGLRGIFYSGEVDDLVSCPVKGPRGKYDEGILIDIVCIGRDVDIPESHEHPSSIDLKEMACGRPPIDTRRDPRLGIDSDIIISGNIHDWVGLVGQKGGVNVTPFIS